MWGLGLVDIKLLSIVKHTGEAAIVSSRIFTRVFSRLDWNYLLIGKTSLLKCIFSLLYDDFRVMRNRKIWNIKSSETIFCAVLHPVTLVWLFVEPNYFVMSAWGIQQWVQSSEWIFEERVIILPFPLFTVEF